MELSEEMEETRRLSNSLVGKGNGTVSGDGELEDVIKDIGEEESLDTEDTDDENGSFTSPRRKFPWISCC